MTNQSENNADLCQLPMAAPPTAAWDQLHARAINEGLLSVPASPATPRWQVAALAASVALLAILGLRVVVDTRAAASQQFANTPDASDLAMQGLQKQSALYERALALAPRKPVVIPVGLASRDTALRDRIVAIDQMLVGTSRDFDARQDALLWSERTMLLRELVGLRYSQPAARFEL